MGGTSATQIRTGDSRDSRGVVLFNPISGAGVNENRGSTRVQVAFLRCPLLSLFNRFRTEAEQEIAETAEGLAVFPSTCSKPVNEDSRLKHVPKSFSLCSLLSPVQIAFRTRS